MPNLIKFTSVAMVAALSAASAMASDAVTGALAVPPIVAPSTVQTPTVNLTAQAKKDVPADEMLVTLRVQHEGTDLSIVNQKVLNELSSALREAQASKDVDAKVGAFSSQQLFTESGKPRGWRVSGQLMLDSKNLRELGEVTGSLSKTMELGYMGFRLSDEKRTELEQELLKQAAEAFKEKATLTATALGFKKYELKEVHISQPYENSHPVYARGAQVQRMALAAEAVSVPTAGGDETVTVNFTGSVALER